MANPRFAETHAHLCDPAFDSDRDKVIAAAKTAGAEFLVEIACAPLDWPNAEKLAAENPQFIFCAFGVHPQDCHQLGTDELAELKRCLSLPCARALGEIGFDYARCDNPRNAQLEAMSALCALANETGLPAVFHCRNPFEGNSKQDAYADLSSSLKSLWRPKPCGRFSGVLHCFSGEEKDAKAALELGLALGVNGTATYPKNNTLRQTLKKSGLANLVLETDCPYLPPQSKRGKRNEPSYIPETAAVLAQLFDCTAENIMEETLLNSRSLFRLA